MCGITGFFGPDAHLQGKAHEVLRTMTASLAHRGPNATGTWCAEGKDVYLGHTRLSVLDLSSSGNQPMRGDDGSVIVYNGEIYNFRELRDELVSCGFSFKGSSDTEVLLLALQKWGLEKTLPRLNGMFAFAHWDAVSRTLSLARDRFGEKPIYYTVIGSLFVFGSELKAIMGHPSFRRDIDREALSLFVRHSYIPAPRAVFKGVRKVKPGHFLQIRGGVAHLIEKAYWRLSDVIFNGRRGDINPEASDFVDEVDCQMRIAVRRRMVADVPLGAFLSGGIDSSLVVALMQAQSLRPIKTFTIGFSEDDYNEAPDAARVAKILGTDHHEVFVGSDECISVIPSLADLYDEPFADSSQIPTALVAKYTRRHVTVALSGDGGDEFWGGYNRYSWSNRVWPIARRIPAGLRSTLGAVPLCLRPATWDRVFGIANKVMPQRFRVRRGGAMLHKVSAAFAAKSELQMYRSMVSQCRAPEELLADPVEPAFLDGVFDDVQDCPTLMDMMMYLDSMTYLPDDILCKVDRATMGVGLEARVPFLDVDVVRYACSIPTDIRIRNGVGKWPLRQALKRYVPEVAFERPKSGFGIPLAAWMRGAMRSWVEDMLDESTLRRDGYFNATAVRRTWLEHLSGRVDREQALWGVLMFQSWLRRWS